jgi:hypothetical protein
MTVAATMALISSAGTLESELFCRYSADSVARASASTSTEDELLSKEKDEPSLLTEMLVSCEPDRSRLRVEWER